MILPAGTLASMAFRKRMNLTAVALHVLAGHGAVEDVEGGEQRRGTMPLVVVRHGP
jgi:hypothetical protein